MATALKQTGELERAREQLDRFLADRTGKKVSELSVPFRSAPRFAWIAPDLVHDGHYASLRWSDRVPRVLRALGPRGVLFLTWDEAAGTSTRACGPLREAATWP